MDITPVLAEDARRITGYGAGVIKINDEAFDAPVIVRTTQVSSWLNPALDKAALEALAEQLTDIEILLIGTGEQGVFIPPSLQQMLRDKTGAGIEVMDTGAACRTYNVLLAEGREVAAALIPV